MINKIKAFIAGGIMLTKLLEWTKGKKTYLFVIAYALYRYLVSNGILQPMPDLETTLLAGAGLSLRDAIK